MLTDLYLLRIDEGIVHHNLKNIGFYLSFIVNYQLEYVIENAIRMKRNL